MMTIEDMCGLLVQNNVQEIEQDLPQDCPQICESARKLVRKQTISDSMRALIDADL